MPTSRPSPTRTLPCFFCVLAGCAVAPPPPSAPSPLLSHSMPGFEGDTVSHNHFYTAQGSGYAMVVRFFSGNNAETKETLAALQRVYEDNSDLVVVAVSADASPGATRQVVDELGLHYPVIIDEGGRISQQS